MSLDLLAMAPENAVQTSGGITIALRKERVVNEGPNRRAMHRANNKGEEKCNAGFLFPEPLSMSSGGR